LENKITQKSEVIAKRASGAAISARDDDKNPLAI